LQHTNPYLMVNILVPTDFSDLSKVAINFAMKVANKVNGNITLLHVVTMIQPARASMRFKFKSLEQELVEIAEEDFQNLLKEVSKSNKTNQSIKYKIVKGTSFNDTLRREAKRLRSGLIVMGTHGASGLKKVVVGSNTASIIEISHIPVLAIPELGEFKHFKNIVYATDLKHLDKELKALLPYAKYFDSTVHMVHVTKNSKNVHALEEKMAKAAVGKIEYNKFTVKAVVNNDIDDAIEKYVKDIKADLLTTFAHDHNFYEKLFNRSVTRKLAFQSVVPLLAFK
jgi:nucleotide-binding universal stress UspA family protein